MRKGFTVIEVLVVVLIVSFIIAAILGVLSAGRDSWQTGNTQLDLRQQARKAMARMVKELRHSGEAVIVNVPADDTPYSTITFQMAEDLDGDGDTVDDSSEIEWGNSVTYVLGGLNGEQLLRTSGGTTTVLANSVTNLQFTRSAASSNIVQISLETAKETILGRPMQSPLNSQAAMRNSVN